MTQARLPTESAKITGMKELRVTDRWSFWIAVLAASGLVGSVLLDSLFCLIIALVLLPIGVACLVKEQRLLRLVRDRSR